jgi:integrase
VYLGRFGSPESKAEYERVCAELRIAAPKAGTTPGPVVRRTSLNEVLLAFLDHAAGHYRRPDGTPTPEVKEFKLAIRPLRALYGHAPAAEFGPLALQAVRRRMIELGWCRNRVNKQVGRVKRIFKWAAGAELVPAGVWQALAAVDGLRRGRSAATETDPVGPAPAADVARVLALMTPTLRAMVELQRLTGMRPGEVRSLTPAEVDTTGPRWVYRPGSARPGGHKTAHLGRDRVVYLGPKAQAVLAPWLAEATDPDARLFTPRRSKEEYWAQQRAARRSKVPPSQVSRRKPAAELVKRWGEAWTDHGYAQAVERACKKAGVPPFAPNQLRHLFATEVRSRYGLEAAQVLLGHATADVTQVYAERDHRLGQQVADEIG